MGLQSDVIGFRFGFGYEKGKRTLRAMSNEQFNNLDEAAEQAIYKHHEATAINFFQLEIQNWTNLQKIIIEKSVEIETMKANRTPSAFREIFEGFTSGFGTQQKEDAKNFFTSMNNTIMNLIGYFSGGKKTVTVTPPAPNNPAVPPSFTNPPATNIPTPPSPSINPFEGQEDYKQPVAITWIRRRDELIKEMHRQKLNLKKKPNSIAVKANFNRATAELIKMSNDFRHPNNFIRSQSLVLRKLISNGLFK